MDGVKHVGGVSRTRRVLSPTRDVINIDYDRSLCHPRGKGVGSIPPNLSANLWQRMNDDLINDSVHGVES